MERIVSVYKRYLNSENSQNAAWLIIDKVIRLGIGVFITIYLTRHLGPVNFGAWSYVIAICSLLGIFSTLGMDPIVVRDLVEEKFRKTEILGTAFVMRFFGAWFVIFLTYLWIILFDGADRSLMIYVIISASSYLFLAFEVIDFHFQSLVKSKFTVLCRIIAFLVASVPRVVGIILEMDLVFFISIATLETVISSLLLVIFYRKHSGLNIFQWKFNKTLFFARFKELIPLILSGMVIMIYMRVDQIMIKHFLDEQAVGIYSAAVRLSEIWYFIPLSIVTSYFPTLMKFKENTRDLRNSQNMLYRNLFILSLIFAVGMTFFSDIIIFLLYGDAFKESAEILKINAWTGIFVSIGIASNSYFLIKNELKLTLYRTLFGVTGNVLLNLVLIPKIGIAGAAYATLISYAISAYLSTWIFKKSRETFYDITKSCSVYIFK